MTFLNPVLARDLWYRALREEYGIVIDIPEGQSIETIRKYLYDARVATKDIQLNDLILRQFDNPLRIVLQRKPADVLP